MKCLFQIITKNFSFDLNHKRVAMIRVLRSISTQMLVCTYIAVAGGLSSCCVSSSSIYPSVAVPRAEISASRAKYFSRGLRHARCFKSAQLHMLIIEHISVTTDVYLTGLSFVDRKRRLSSCASWYTPRASGGLVHVCTN